MDQSLDKVNFHIIGLAKCSLLHLMCAIACVHATTCVTTTMVIILWEFLMFSFHHKWNEAWLLVINWYIQVASQVASWLKTWEIREVWNNVKTSWKYNLVPSLRPKKKILSIPAKDPLKIEIDLFPQCTISHEN